MSTRCYNLQLVFTYAAVIMYAKRDRQEQEGLAVASIARDDPSTLPGDHLSPSSRHAPRPQGAVNVDWNLKPKLAIMRQCTSVTGRQIDRQTDTDIIA